MSEQVLNPTLKYKPADFYELAALRQLKLTPDSNKGVYALSGCHSGTLVLIGPVSTFTRGPRKGERKYGPRRDCETVIVTGEQLKAEVEIFEAETGRCSTCYGNGLSWSGWAVDKGNYFRQCTKCDGSGERKP